MRIDRFLRNYLGKIPQGLIEKNLRNGKIKLNQKKVKSSQKVRTDDKISLFNFNFEENIKVPRSSPPEELQYFKQEGEVHRGILHTKPGSILPVAGREASVVKIYVFPEIAYKPPSIGLTLLSVRYKVQPNPPPPTPLYSALK